MIKDCIIFMTSFTETNQYQNILRGSTVNGTPAGTVEKISFFTLMIRIFFFFKEGNFGKGDTNKKLLWIFCEMGQSFDPFPSQKGFNEKGLCFPSYYDGQEEKVCGKE